MFVVAGIIPKWNNGSKTQNLIHKPNPMDNKWGQKCWTTAFHISGWLLPGYLRSCQGCGAADNWEDCSRVKDHLKLLPLNARKGLGLLSWEEKGEMSHNSRQAKIQNVYRTQKQESLQIISWCLSNRCKPVIINGMRVDYTALFCTEKISFLTWKG